MEKRFFYARLLLPTSCIIMRLIDVLTQDCIIADLKGSDKREVLEEMVEELSFKFGGIDKEKLLEVLLEREKLGSTGIGYGVAIPHARLKGLDGIVVYFGRSLKGAEFQTMDDKPAHLFFLIVAPDNSTVSHLKILARISRLLQDIALRKKLMEASTQDELYQIIMEEDRKF